MKDSVKGLSTDGLLVAELMTKLDGEGGSLFVQFEGRVRHEVVDDDDDESCLMRSTIKSMTTNIMMMRARINAMSRTEKSMRRSILLLATVLMTRLFTVDLGRRE